jgi:alpha-galactosidase
MSVSKSVGILVITAAAAIASGADPASTPRTPSNAAPSAAPTFWSFAPTPPMGWNSWDCFGTSVTEEQTLANADYMAEHLKSHGWQYIVVDIQWYEPQAKGLNYRKGAVLEMDENGRLLPAPNRFPSTAASRDFTPVAERVHAKGLKFGLHLLRGIPRQAVERNTPIAGTSFHAADIADKHDTCPWNPDMYGVDMSKPGAQEYYNSVLQLMASWGVDFIKVDDLSRPYHKAEIEAIRKAIDLTGRAIVFSTSPGATPVAQGVSVENNANMWRISDDFWDSWKALKEQFTRLDAWTPYRAGQNGADAGGHFPDADMLPLANVRAFERNGWTHFTQDEQVTLMTLWSIARSPLILGANLPHNDDFTLSLLTNDEVLAVDQHSLNNRQLFREGDTVVWTADVPDSPDKYLALFNTHNELTGPKAAPQTLTVQLKDLGLTAASVHDLWSHKDLGPAAATFSADLAPHTARLFRLSPH